MPKTKKFKALIKSVKKQYLFKPVPLEYRKKYGKIYSEKDVKSVAFAIAVKKGWRV